MAGKYKTASDTCIGCPAGWHTKDNDLPNCEQCGINLKGETSAAGSSVCSLCDLGKHQSTPGICEDCGTGTYQDSKGEKKCKNCPVDRYGTETGKSSLADCSKCEDDRTTGTLTGAVSDKMCLCKREEYYTDATGDCSPCPVGADCSASDGLQIEHLRSEASYWRANNKTDKFVSCTSAYKTGDVQGLAKFYCVGGEIQIDIDNSTVIDIPWYPNDQCVTGSSGPLCAVCAEDFVKIGNDCRPCPGGANYLAPAMTLVGQCFLIFCITLLIICKTHAHKTAKIKQTVTEIKILVSWLQILSVVAQTFGTYFVICSCC